MGATSSGGGAMTPEAVERQRERVKKWRENNPEKIRARWQKYYAANKKRILEKNRQWRAEHPEKLLVYRQKYHALNRDKDNERLRQWRKNNPDKAREMRLRYSKSEKGKLAKLRQRYKKDAQIGASVGSSKLVTCFGCRSVFALEDAAQRGWKFVGKYGCICDLCE